jgi:mRNA interferase YafQ
LNHVLLRSTTFVRDSRRMLRKRPDLTNQILMTLQLLQSNPFAPSLKSHKLKGKLKHAWACSGGYDLRIVFSFTKHAGKPAVLLESLGTHDEVY